MFAPEMHDLRCRRSLLQISGVLGSAIFIELSIYMGLVARQVEDHQENQSILCCASITTTHIPVIPLTSRVFAKGIAAKGSVGSGEEAQDLSRLQGPEREK
jgi:hypothetical protein